MDANMSDIDVVISWVDGNDSKHKEKLNAYLNPQERSKIPGAHVTRFRSVNEIKFCVLSILKFAPFVRNIYIITDNQEPSITNDIKINFSERLNSIKIIDHKEIFEGYEDFLPVFNARSIETFMWRIKGLANKFVYFNDDFFLVREIKPEDWFLNNKPVMRGKLMPKPAFILLAKDLVNFFKKFFFNAHNKNFSPSFKTSMWWAAKIVGFKWRYFKISHTPHPVCKSTFEFFFNKNSAILEKNANHKFRYYYQFNPVSLVNHLEILRGNKQFRSYDEVYLKPINRGANYIEQKIETCKKNKNVKFVCAQSLDLATQNDREKLLNWLENLLSNSYKDIE